MSVSASTDKGYLNERVRPFWTGCCQADLLEGRCVSQVLAAESAGMQDVLIPEVQRFYENTLLVSCVHATVVVGIDLRIPPEYMSPRAPSTPVLEPAEPAQVITLSISSDDIIF
jgi:hypothetical protein